MAITLDLETKIGSDGMLHLDTLTTLRETDVKVTVVLEPIKAENTANKKAN